MKTVAVLLIASLAGGFYLGSPRTAAVGGHRGIFVSASDTSLENSPASTAAQSCSKEELQARAKDMLFNNGFYAPPVSVHTSAALLPSGQWFAVGHPLKFERYCPRTFMCFAIRWNRRSPCMAKRGGSLGLEATLFRFNCQARQTSWLYSLICLGDPEWGRRHTSSGPSAFRYVTINLN